MKKIIIILFIATSWSTAYGQNTFPIPSGNVGIGVVSPTAPLQVKGVADFISTYSTNFIHFDYASNGNKVRSYGTNLFLETRNYTEDIEFRTDNSVTPLMIVKGTGNVGIGITDPSHKLQVKGVSQFISPYDLNNVLHFDYASNGNKLRSYGTNLFLETRNNTEDIEFRTDNSVTALMMIKGTGNVGIGTTDPLAKVHIIGGGVSTSLSNISSTSTLRLDVANSAISMGFGYVNSDNPFLQAYNNVNGLASSLILNPFEGNVGIGTTTPLAKLSVNGQIRATEVKVMANINVPDYVFEKDYELRTLKETKEYLTENKHLPEIPSAAEIGENGIDLGDMNMRLLKKIEELTLHLIEQNERIEKLEKERKSE